MLFYNYEHVNNHIINNNIGLYARTCTCDMIQGYFSFKNKEFKNPSLQAYES